MTLKLVSELPFGCQPITPEQFAGDAKTVVLDLRKPMLLSVDNRVIVQFPEGPVDVPSGEPASFLIGCGALLCGYVFSDAPKVQLKPPVESRKVGY